MQRQADGAHQARIGNAAEFLKGLVGGYGFEPQTLSV
jgi:hypothetical protein